MEVGKVNRIEGLNRGQSPEGGAPLAHARGRLLKAFGTSVVALASLSLAAFDALAEISFDGNASGVFVTPTGGPNLVSSGMGSSSFRWGTGVESLPSLLSFTGESVTGAAPNQPFKIGTLSYANGQVLGGTEAYSVGLQTTINISGVTRSFDYSFELINTPNNGDSLLSADSVLLANSFPTTKFSIDGVEYTLNAAFGSVTGSGFSAVNQFFVLEGGVASADLIGSVAVVPEPSTILGGISAGGLLVAFLARRLRRRSPLFA